jgi:large subunit ribosomal protein L35
MPKKKTKKSAVKRLRKTARGKIKYSKPGSGHLLSSKSRKRKRNLRKQGVLGQSDHKRMLAMLGK